jgi:hypothetical protein
MKIVEGKEKEYSDYQLKNSKDAYSNRVVTYGEDWANLMEAHIAEGIPLENCADTDSHTADTDGITGFMYGCAVTALARFWIHGEALRKWHNLKTQLGHEGEKANESGGVLNPAILNVG